MDFAAAALAQRKTMALGMNTAAPLLILAADTLARASLPGEVQKGRRGGWVPMLLTLIIIIGK